MRSSSSIGLGAIASLALALAFAAGTTGIAAADVPGAPPAATAAATSPVDPGVRPSFELAGLGVNYGGGDGETQGYGGRAMLRVGRAHGFSVAVGIRQLVVRRKLREPVEDGTFTTAELGLGYAFRLASATFLRMEAGFAVGSYAERENAIQHHAVIGLSAGWALAHHVSRELVITAAMRLHKDSVSNYGGPNGLFGYDGSLQAVALELGLGYRL